MTTMSNKLAEIIAHKRKEVEVLESRAGELRRAALARNEYRGFRNALLMPAGTTLIAEVKKASPSAGVIAGDFDPVRQAGLYEAAGAHCLSVLTDTKYFQGSLDDLKAVRARVDIPILRKDFTVSPLQIYEAAAAGADAILLIVAALTDEELLSLQDTARSVQLDVLVEVHDLAEMDRALDMGADMIGINNRNLKTFEVSLETTVQLAQEIPSDCLAVSESGIRTRADVALCEAEGIKSILVGETLMRSSDVGASVAQLLGR
jgi:indole-3-glycerol phosphate synthase